MSKIVCETLEEKHLPFICSVTENLSEKNGNLCLLNDFRKKYFAGFICKSSDNNEEAIFGYILYYYSYSTWEARVVYISVLHLIDSIDTEFKTLIFEKMCLNLIAIARDMKCSRINYNLNIIRNPLYEQLFVEKIRAFNLTKLENWTFFCMDNHILKSFGEVDRNKFEINIRDKNIKIRKFDVKTDCDKVRELIYELAVFEKLEDQFRMKTDELVRDYKDFYDCFVAEDAKNDDVIAFALYYYNYSLDNGRGCYLEDLYVKPEWRGLGIGTLLWRKVANETLDNDASYLEWNCLDWNTDAIQFYLKNKAYNSSSVNNTHYIRIRRERIYEDN